MSLRCLDSARHVLDSGCVKGGVTSRGGRNCALCGRRMHGIYRVTLYECETVLRYLRVYSSCLFERDPSCADELRAEQQRDDFCGQEVKGAAHEASVSCANREKGSIVLLSGAQNLKVDENMI